MKEVNQEIAITYISNGMNPFLRGQKSSLFSTIKGSYKESYRDFARSWIGSKLTDDSEDLKLNSWVETGGHVVRLSFTATHNYNYKYLKENLDFHVSCERCPQARVFLF